MGGTPRASTTIGAPTASPTCQLEIVSTPTTTTISGSEVMSGTMPWETQFRTAVRSLEARVMVTPKEGLPGPARVLPMSLRRSW